MSDEALSGVESVSQTKAMEPTSSPEEHSGVEASVDQPSTVQEPSSSVSEVSPSSGNFCCSFVSNMNPRARELIYWSNPVKSGGVLGVTLVLLSMVRCCGLLSVASFLGLIVLALSFSIHAVSSVAKRFLSMDIPNPLLRYLSTPVEIPEDMVNCVATRAAKSFACASRELCRLYTIVDIPDSFKFGVLLWLVYFLTSRMNFLTMVMIAEVLLFTVPKVYDLYQVQINAAASAARLQAMQLLEKARSVPVVDQCLAALAPKEKQS